MTYFERELEEKLRRAMSAPEILAVVGPRQSGKTTLIKKLLKEITSEKTVKEVTLENTKDKLLFENDIDSFATQYAADILFIDEIQYAKDSGKQLKYLFDTKKTKIIVSGSSAIDISIQSTRYLVGRVFIYTLYPFSFREFMKAKNPELEAITRKAYGKEIQDKLDELFDEFTLFGGYPRVILAQTKEDKQEVLENIYNTALLKDIRDIYGLSERKTYAITKALSLQIGSLVNYGELAAITELDRRDVKKIITALEQAFMIQPIMPFSRNKRVELVKNPKIYFLDTGFRNASISNFEPERTDRGHLYENVFATELVKAKHTVHFWRTKAGAEIDFIVDEKTPIEIKTTAEKPSRAMYSYIEKYSPEQAIIAAHHTQEKQFIIEKTTIRTMHLTTTVLLFA